MDTIVALATPPGKSGVAVLRLSGPQAVAALSRLNKDIPAPRCAVVRVLRTAGGDILDEALVLVFEAGHSFTGEETVEIQCHGSVAVVNAILSELMEMSFIRLAEPGEFTRRALENDRMTLAEVEGLGDLVEAETDAQRQQALRVFSGEFGDVIEGWRQDLIRAAALVEATIDFADEDLPVDVTPEVSSLIEKVIGSLSSEISGVKTAERVRAGFEVAIVGAPNVGKSTLLNALAGREAAITSEFAGTTRDIIEVRMDLEGLPVTFLDTAGIRDSDHFVESIGIDLARRRANTADIRVVLTIDGVLPDIEVRPDDIVLKAKGDLSGERVNVVSGKTGLGVSDLVDRVITILKGRTSKIGFATRLRHQQSMSRALGSLSQAAEFLASGEERSDVVAEELRSAVRALDSLIGRIDVENVLDEIFANFCIGK
jgi:tRNA modification GTPase